MSTTVTYKGATLTTVENETKTLTTGGTWMEGDLTLTDVTQGGAVDDFPMHDGDSHIWLTVSQEYIDNFDGVQIWFYQNKANGVEINWGDGSAVETVSGTGEKSPIHAYTTAGDYRIDLHAVNDTLVHFGHTTETIVGRFITSNARVYALDSLVHSCETGSTVDTIVAGSQRGVRRFDCSQSTLVTSFPTFQNCNMLRYLVLPPNITTQGGQYNTQNLYSLPEMTIPASLTQIPARIEGCYSLMKLTMLPTTPPTLAETRIVTKTGFRIIVPYSDDHSVLTAYQNASNWSTYASYMEEASA